MINEIQTHRSIRKYSSKPIPKSVLDEVLLAGIRASNTGNMQMYSIVVTQDAAIKEQLLPCHFNQPMVVQAPVVITFCADVHRFTLWCRQRDAEPHFDNFIWFVNSVIDVTLTSANVSLQAQAHGLGICYLGTTTYNADKISQILQLPMGVIPVTTLVDGYPDEQPELTDRLSLEAVVHYETYKDYTAEQIDLIWSKKESSALTERLKAENGLPNLAKIFTEKRYRGQDNILFSNKYFEMLRSKGFFNQ